MQLIALIQEFSSRKKFIPIYGSKVIACSFPYLFQPSLCECRTLEVLDAANFVCELLTLFPLDGRLSVFSQDLQCFFVFPQVNFRTWKLKQGFLLCLQIQLVKNQLLFIYSVAISTCNKSWGTSINDVPRFWPFYTYLLLLCKVRFWGIFWTPYLP